MRTYSHSPVFPSVLCQAPFTVLTNLSKYPTVLPSPPMALLTTSFLFSALPLKYPPLPGYRLWYLPVLIVSGLLLTPEGSAYRDPPSGLRCVSVPLLRPPPPWYLAVPPPSAHLPALTFIKLCHILVHNLPIQQSLQGLFVLLNRYPREHL